MRDEVESIAVKVNLDDCRADVNHFVHFGFSQVGAETTREIERQDPSGFDKKLGRLGLYCAQKGGIGGGFRMNGIKRDAPI
jgi:hypothetical protein